MLETSFGSPPIVREYGDAGRDGGGARRRARLVGALGGARPPGDVVTPIDLSAAPQPATDDWPFLYLREPGIAAFIVA